jgi:hypothetical protein
MLWAVKAASNAWACSKWRQDQRSGLPDDEVQQSPRQRVAAGRADASPPQRPCRERSQMALRVPINHPAWSRGMLVLVEGSAESVSSVDFKVPDPLCQTDWLGQWAERRGLALGWCGRCPL